MIGTDSSAVVSEVFFYDPCAKRHRAEDRCMSGRMVGKAENQVWVHGGEGREYAQMDVAEVFQTACVNWCCIA